MDLSGKIYVKVDLNFVKVYLSYIYIHLLIFIRNEYDAIWTARYNALVEYTKENGNARVPCNHKTLGVWVGTQRKQFKLKQKGKKSHLTDEREELLNKIDFVWDVNVWSERFAELAAFKQQFGHFSVPVEFPNKQLRPWISTQRSQYRFKQEKKPSQLTDRRIELLNSIGFPWKTKEDWQTRFNEALLYYHENGDLNIGRNDEVSNSFCNSILIIFTNSST